MVRRRGSASHNIIALANSTFVAYFSEITGGGDGLKGEYYDNKNLTTLKLARVDPVLILFGGVALPTRPLAPILFPCAGADLLSPYILKPTLFIRQRTTESDFG